MFENTDVMIEREREDMTNKVFSQIKETANAMSRALNNKERRKYNEKRNL